MDTNEDKSSKPKGNPSGGSYLGEMRFIRGALAVSAVHLFSPAKLNLFLAVTGRRPDGFHDLVSVVAPLRWGDTLDAEPAAEFSLACNDPAVPVDATNLVAKAARVFREATGWRGAARFTLDKKIPPGAGLGGGSSNGAMALRALNRLAGEPLASADLVTLAAQVGSDCALFLQDGPVAMRGRGERVEPLPRPAATRLSGRRVLLFKPAFGISTPWSYARLAAGAPASYLPAERAEARLADWLDQAAAPAEALLYNNMEWAAFGKFMALPVLLGQLRQRFGLAPRMSGSGSACFALLPAGADAAAITTAVRSAWGPSTLAIETCLM
jgi:4-diphosphocytidyl-2-C-methyl-D-erythritol kinase